MGAQRVGILELGYKVTIHEFNRWNHEVDTHGKDTSHFPPIYRRTLLNHQCNDVGN